MTSVLAGSDLESLHVNSAWASLPLFDRTGWKRVRFGDVVENCNETCEPAEAGLERFVAMEHLEPGSLHVRSWGNVAYGTTFTRRCRPGQVLFGKRRAYQRKVAVAEFEAVVSGDIYVLAPKDTERLLPELLPFLCLSERFFQHAVGTSAGSLSPRTNWSSLASFEFDLPPLDQQRRFAEILWAVDEVEETQMKLCDEVKNARDQWFADVLQGASAETIKIADLGKIITGTTPKTAEPKNYDPPERLFVSPADIGSPRYVTTTEKRISEVGLLTGRAIPRNAVMVVCIGSTIGKVAMAAEACLTNQQINSIVCSERRDPLVAYYALLRQQGLFRQNASCTAVPILNKGNFTATEIPYPKQHIEAKVAERLLEFEGAEENTSAAIENSRALKTHLINAIL